MKPTLQEIQDVIAGLIYEMVGDPELSGNANIGPQTRLAADLQLASVDVFELLALIEGHFGRTFQFPALLIRDGVFVQELDVATLSEFVHANFDAAPSELVSLHGIDRA